MASPHTYLCDKFQTLRPPQSSSTAETKARVSDIFGVLNGLTEYPLLHISLLDALDPALDTLPYLFVLSRQIDYLLGKNNVLNDNLRLGGPLYQKLTRFLTVFDRNEVHHAGAMWRKCVNVLATVILDETNADLTAPVILMAGAILRLDPSAGTFTSNHLKYVQVCMHTELYHQACLILDNDIHSFAPPRPLQTGESLTGSSPQLIDGNITVLSGLTEKISLNDVLEYYLTGAMAYIGLKRWSSALFFLEHVLSVPSSNAASAYTLEAYKKWTFVNLLVNGKSAPLPKIAGGASLKTLRALAAPYDTVVEAFSLHDSAKLRAEVEEARMIFSEDGNYGLALNVVDHHQKLAISGLGRVYAAIPLASVTLDVAADEAEDYINSLIGEGILNGRLEQPAEAGGPVVLRFFQDNASGPQTKSEVRLRQDLTVQANRIKSLAQHVATVDQRISVTKEYLDFVRKARKNKEPEWVPGDDAMDVSFADAPMAGQVSDEENVMADAE